MGHPLSGAGKRGWPPTSNHHVALATCQPPYPTPSSATRNWVRLACVRCYDMLRFCPTFWAILPPFCHPVGTDQGFGVSLEHEDGDTRGGRGRCWEMSAYTSAARHAAKCASQVELGMWHSRAGADGPARRSISVGRTWRTGPPPSSFAAGCRGPRQDGQAAKTKLLRRSCLRFWTRAWGQREFADKRTGHLKSPTRLQDSFKGGLDIPPTHVQFSLLRREHPIWTLDAP